jgi:hypothetical protein
LCHGRREKTALGKVQSHYAGSVELEPFLDVSRDTQIDSISGASLGADVSVVHVSLGPMIGTCAGSQYEFDYVK